MGVKKFNSANSQN